MKANHILSREGYLLNKGSITKEQIRELKKELTVIPFDPFEFSKKEKKKFKVYKENDEYINIPKYYGLKKFGIPKLWDEDTGDKVKLKFKGKLRPYQKEISKLTLNYLKKNDGGLISLGCGKGKCLGYDTPIMMYDGSIKMVQNIKIGDQIMGDDSTPRNILSLARGKEMMYKVVPAKGESYTVNESHILSLKYVSTEKKGDVKDISVLDYLKSSDKKVLHGYKVPIIFSEKKLNKEPYNFGLELDNNKYIPNNYKCNSRKNQLKLLAGIIDSNGEYIDDGYNISFDNEKILLDIIFIARSLGYHAHKYINNNSKYQITIYGNSLHEIPVKCMNKKAINNKNIDNVLTTSIKLEKQKIDDYYGFEIDGNHRFLLGDFTVTHNTVIALYLACRIKVKTLVIVHKTFLLNQWQERASQFTNAKIGKIQRDVIDIEGKDIVIGMLQSIAKEKYDSDIFHDFGLVIFDEAHHAPSRYFSRALPIISCKKSLALSATPNRTDKLEKVLYWFMGDIIYKAEKEVNKNVLVNVYNYNLGKDKFKEYVHRWTKKPMRSKTLTKLTQINNRNIFIIKVISELLADDKRVLLILSDRIEHLETLKEMLDNKELCSTALYIGGMKQKDLTESATKTVLFGTYGMASEALDIPRLNTLLLVTPRRKIEQSIGRILRKKDHVTRPLIIDLIDNIGALERQGKSRISLYKKLKYNIIMKDVKDNNVIKEQEIQISSPKNKKVELEDVGFID